MSEIPITGAEERAATHTPQASVPDVPASLAGTPEETNLEFELDEPLIARLLRAPALQAVRAGPIRNSALSLVWHDTADAALADLGLALCQSGAAGPKQWRLERLHPDRALDWLPCETPPILAKAAHPDLLGYPLPGPLAPAAAFQGRLRTLKLALANGPATLGIVLGTLRGVAQDQPACRITLSGHAGDVAGLITALAETLPLRPPQASLAALAMQLARGRSVRPRQLGAPEVPAGLSTEQALRCITAHLADVIGHWATLVPNAAGPEPVHQMRVAVRRLRSALSVFRPAVAARDQPALWLDQLAADLRDLAARLGAARDWDVFLTQTGQEVRAAFTADRRIEQLLDSSARKCRAAYADIGAYLASQEWVRLSVRLALLPTERPWQSAANPVLAEPARNFAAHALDRRLKHLLQSGADISTLPVSALHDTRKQAKRLRYASEFFAPLFPNKAVRKYLPRLSALQETLGTVNDADVAANLMRQLGGGTDRAFAAGVVQGFGAAQSARACARVQRAWARLYRAAPFWD
jgi:CHAD domain-containing protein